MAEERSPTSSRIMHCRRMEYRRYDVRKIRDSPKDMPRYRMRSCRYRVTFFIHHNRLVIEVISIRRKKTGMDY